ncbi:MAG: hypothetical protein A2Y62_15900 [Candidatus Fischerbacteria bacterium RBG_13_37_8]|uniref:CN hydrolase domain-containing protein n=1 Tax=Candidatus Fischerbacteria bacterium RBG_13_37_8 TaxID=1817863 RepID=A0A1F5VSL7_9BACT|nr:MAG: hypothetical protein A2Y62_15900 [Candidatus Fischerbacteria bacterium RBG_13_37_8]
MEIIDITVHTLSRPANIAICQKKLGSFLNDEEKEAMHNFNPHFLCLPELFFVNDNMKNYTDASQFHNEGKEYLRVLSLQLMTVVIGGTLILKENNNFKSISYVFEKGEEIGHYAKINLTENEKRNGFVKGIGHFHFKRNNLTCSILICNDIFSEQGFHWARENKIDIIFMPTGSPYKPAETVAEKFQRDNNLYTAMAEISNGVIVKVCGIGTVFEQRLQGRSLLASPKGILYRVAPEQEMEEHIIGLSVNSGQ